MKKTIFKAKRKDNGEWIQGDYMKHQPFLQLNHYIKENTVGPVEWIMIDEDTLCESTGFTDINGDEIFFNDTIAFDEEIENLENDIVWNSEWQFHSEHTLDNKQEDFYDHNARIIGNIHDKK